MRTIRPALMGTMVLVLALTANTSDAKRFGAKSSSSASPPVAKVEPRKSSETGGSPVLRYGAAAAAGSLAGHAAARAMTDADQEPVAKEVSTAELAAATEQQRLEKLSELERKARAEELEKKTEQILKSSELRVKGELAAKEAEEKRRKDEANARRAVAEEEQAELKRQALAREMSCVIKPVMSDAEINQCKWAWNSPRP